MTDDIDWIALTDTGQSWTKRYPKIGEIVREHLTTIPPTHTWDTKRLVNAMMPDPHGPAEVKAKSRLYHIVDVLANHQLAEYVFKGPERMLYGRWVTPKAWRHAPLTAPTTGASTAVVQIPGSTGKCWQAMSLWETRLVLSEPHHPFHVQHHANFRAIVEVVHEIEEGKPAPWLEPDEDESLNDLIGE